MFDSPEKKETDEAVENKAQSQTTNYFNWKQNECIPFLWLSYIHNQRPREFLRTVNMILNPLNSNDIMTNNHKR